DTCLGIHAWERQIRQTVILDLEMATDIRAAAHADDIQLTLDYDAVAKRLTQAINTSEFKLLETLAEYLATIVQNEFNVPWLRLQLSKPGALTNAENVAVNIERVNIKEEQKK